MTSYKIKKVITNNILRALDINETEVILIGKGIGFNKKANDIVSSSGVENLFVLQNNQEKGLYEQLLRSTSPKLISIANEAIDYIQQHVDKPLNDHIHIALTDHISFMVRRCKMGIPVENPFSLETENLYPKEADIAAHVVDYISQELNLPIPRGEIGFITLHIVSSLTNDSLFKAQKLTYLVSKLTEVMEDQLMIQLDKTDLNYTRLVTHLRFAIERAYKGEVLSYVPELEEILKKQYSECYALAYKLVKIMQNELNKKMNSSEVIYLAMHLYRFIQQS